MNSVDCEGQVIEMWICVHDTVFGGKSRNLADKIGCSQDEAVGLLVRLWIWGLTNCDREGLVQYASIDTIAEVLVQGLSKKLDPKEIALALIDCEYLDVEDDAIYIHDWSDWQQYWYSYQDRKNSNNESKRKEREAAKAAKEPEVKKPTPKPSGKEDYTPEFEDWWKVYPRKVNKIDAFSKYKARKKEGFKAEILLQAAECYASKVKKSHTEKQYMLHPETFLGPALRFRDFLPEKPETEQEDSKEDSWANPFEKWRDN